MALLVFGDETGSNNLKNIDLRAPNFALCLVVCNEETYKKQTHPRVQQFKKEFCLHEKVGLHSYEIRHKKNDFSHIDTKEKWEHFCNGMNAMMAEATYKLLVSIIKMEKHKARYAYPIDPYDLSIEFLMERLYFYMEEHGETEARIIFEARGKKNDDRIRLLINHFCQHGNQHIKAEKISRLSFKVWFETKKKCVAGLEIADLAVFPIMLHYSGSPNRSLKILSRKIYRVKVFP